MEAQYLAPTADTSPHTTARYSAQQIAEEVGLGESTIRTRHFDWISKVAPAALLKDSKGYTQLAYELFTEFAQVATSDRNSWVEEAKAKYAHEWSGAGIIDGELVPDEVGGVLALIQSQNTSADLTVSSELASLEQFIEQINEAEQSFSESELAQFRTNGAKRGIARFKIETQTELEVLNHLRQKRMEGGESA